MKEFKVRFGSLSDVQDFVRIASMQQFNVEAACGTDRIDAKSFMGLFSLDLREPIQITVDGSESEVERFCRSISSLLQDS